MNTRDDARYRLELAEGYERQAEEAYASGRWHGCLADAQEAVENAVKSIVACLAPVVKTHEPGKQLERLLANPSLPDELRMAAQAMLPDFGSMGMETHVRATYGDEKTFTPPWRLIQQPEADDALKKARAAVALARRFHALYFPPTPE